MSGAKRVSCEIERPLPISTAGPSMPFLSGECFPRPHKSKAPSRKNYNFHLIVTFSLKRYPDKVKGGNMLYWAVVFLVVALIAGVLGFGGVAVAAAGMAKLLFYIFLVIFLITLVMGLGRRGRSV